MLGPRVIVIGFPPDLTSIFIYLFIHLFIYLVTNKTLYNMNKSC